MTARWRHHRHHPNARALGASGGDGAFRRAKAGELETEGVRVMLKGQPKTEEVIPLAALKESINKAAYSYTDPPTPR